MCSSVLSIVCLCRMTKLLPLPPLNICVCASLWRMAIVLNDESWLSNSPLLRQSKLWQLQEQVEATSVYWQGCTDGWGVLIKKSEHLQLWVNARQGLGPGFTNLRKIPVWQGQGSGGRRGTQKQHGRLGVGADQGHLVAFLQQGRRISAQAPLIGRVFW